MAAQANSHRVPQVIPVPAPLIWVALQGRDEAATKHSFPKLIEAAPA